MISQKQLSLADIFEDCKDIFESDKPQFLTLLENHIDLDEIIPFSFYNHYYAATGRNRKYPLTAMLWTLIIQRLFSIPTDSLLPVFRHYSRHLLLCPHQLYQTMRLNSSTLTDISATLTSSVLLPMDLELFVPFISIIRIILLPILTL